METHSGFYVGKRLQLTPTVGDELENKLCIFRGEVSGIREEPARMRLLHTGFLGSLSCDTLFMGMGICDCIAWRSTPPLPIVRTLASRGNLRPFSP